MKIFFDGRLFGVRHRGIGMYNQMLLENLQAVDDKNEYYILNPGTATYLANDRWHIINYQDKVYGLSEQIHLPIWQQKINPTFSHFPHFNAPLLAKRPYIVTVHDLIIHQHPSERATTLPKGLYRAKLAAYYLVVKQSLTRADIILTVSQSAKNDIIKYYPLLANKIKVIYEAPCLQMENNKNQSRLVKENYWLYVGAAYPHKNLELLLKSFQAAQPTRYKLLLVGRPDYFYKRLQLLVNELNLSHKVILWGEATQESLKLLYRDCDCYIAPGQAEGFDLSAVQAAVFNKPIIASKIAVHQEILGRSAIYFDQLQPAELTAIMFQLDECGPESYKNIEPTINLLTKFSWRKTAQETLTLYQNLN